MKWVSNENLQYFSNKIKEKINNKYEKPSGGIPETDLAANVQNKLNPNYKSELIDIVYPVGSIYMSVNNVSPATFFGGTWERVQDRFLLAAGSTYAAGSTGGSSSHNHDYRLSFANYNLGFDASVDGLGAYNYDSKSYVKSRVAGGVSAKGLYNVSVETHTLSVSYLDGGNTSYKENLPPYLAVYIWKRIQ